MQMFFVKIFLKRGDDVNRLGYSKLALLQYNFSFGVCKFQCKIFSYFFVGDFGNFIILLLCDNTYPQSGGRTLCKHCL